MTIFRPATCNCELNLEDNPSDTRPTIPCPMHEKLGLGTGKALRDAVYLHNLSYALKYGSNQTPSEEELTKQEIGVEKARSSNPVNDQIIQLESIDANKTRYLELEAKLKAGTITDAELKEYFQLQEILFGSTQTNGGK